MIQTILLLCMLMGVAALLSLISTGWLRRWLERKAILDRPNERSNHRIPTPRGGGLAVIGVTLLGWLLVPLLFAYTDKPVMMPYYPVFLAMVAVLMLVSWLDDKQGLPFHLRLIIHILAAIIGVNCIDGTLFNEQVPLWLDKAVMVILWVWYINLTNFMDGIDGITGMQSLFILLGVAFITFFSGYPDMFLAYGCVLAGALLGFLWWNWHPAKIFLGDSGSVPIGYILGFFLLQMMAMGFWVPALMLPLYPLLDTSITLAKRILRREKFWQAHSQHYYQQSVRGGRSHCETVRRIAWSNLAIYFTLFAGYFNLLPELLSLAIGGGIGLFTLFSLKRSPKLSS